MTAPGRLKERVRFECRTNVDDGYGNKISGPWTAQFTRRAQYLMRAGSEATIAARLEGQQPVTIIVRFDEQTKTITPAWRAVDVNTGRIYAIRAAEDMGRKRAWWTMVCIEGATS